MQHQEINNYYDLTKDFIWGLKNKYNTIPIKKSIENISSDFSFEVDWDEGIENWAALHGKKETDFIILSCLIPFGFVHRSLFDEFKKNTYLKVLFFDDYHRDKIFLKKEIMNTLFYIPEGYYDFTKPHTIADFIYTTYT